MDSVTSFRSSVETRAAYRWRTAVLALGWGWAAGLLVTSSLIGRDVLADGLTIDDVMGFAVWILIAGAFLAVFMLPGAALFWVWHRHVSAPFAGFVPEVGLGALTGALALLCWWPAGGKDTYVTLLPLAVVVGVVTFIAGALYRRGEGERRLVQAVQ